MDRGKLMTLTANDEKDENSHLLLQFLDFAIKRMTFQMLKFLMIRKNAI